MGLTMSSDSANAGWICVKNESKDTVVIQEVPDAPNAKRGKMMRLLPGEVHREFRPGDGSVKFEVFDPKCLTKPLLAERIFWGIKDTLFQLQLEARTGLWSLIKAVPKMMEPVLPAKR